MELGRSEESADWLQDGKIRLSQRKKEKKKMARESMTCIGMRLPRETVARLIAEVSASRKPPALRSREGMSSRRRHIGHIAMRMASCTVDDRFI